MSFFDCLPCFILNHSPKIIVSFEMDFLRNLSAFQKAIPQNEKFTMFLQLGWSAELPEVANELKNRLAEAENIFPEARFIILANSPGEVEVIKDFCEVYLANHNAFLDPSRYPLAKKGKRKFDAVYIARITPFKRHFLAEKINNLHLIGSYSEKEKDYFMQTISNFLKPDGVRRYLLFSLAERFAKLPAGLRFPPLRAQCFPAENIHFAVCR